MGNKLHHWVLAEIQQISVHILNSRKVASLFSTKINIRLSDIFSDDLVEKCTMFDIFYYLLNDVHVIQPNGQYFLVITKVMDQ